MGGKKPHFFFLWCAPLLPSPPTSVMVFFVCSRIYVMKSQGARACMACLGRPSSPLLDVSSLTLLISEGLFPAFYLIPSPVTQSVYL